ncbi:hypothetical protein GH714_037223 [Hevea brasiliensis]|uniref:Anaphase-promoting complex subunit 1 n=1 Tax=Hevea brasiliensis TaxID=3981 RepID=A0A6A6L9H1_HEVBR|nr:hypothetical protein GH714_037223 [Hevea brasiliensis]
MSKILERCLKKENSLVVAIFRTRSFYVPAAEGSSPAQSTFLSTSPLLGARDISRPRREIRHSPQQNATFLGAFDRVIKADTVTLSSHLILKDLLEEPQIFLATDDDSAPVICFLLQEQKKLLSVRLQSLEINNEIIFDVKPDMSWSIPAIAAAPVVVTRPRVKVGLLPYTDIIVLAPENTLLLYSGKQCLCKYLLPSCLGKGRLSHNSEFSETVSIPHDLKILGLADAVEGRVNLITNNGQMFRCVLRRSPSSVLVNDCITAMAEGLSSSYYNHFLGVLWGDTDSECLSKVDYSVDSEWKSFCGVILGMCRKSSAISHKHSSSQKLSSWEFLLNSKFHMNYRKLSSITGISSGISLDVREIDSSGPNMKCEQSSEESFSGELLQESLGSLHALYENLKLDNLRKLRNFCSELGTKDSLLLQFLCGGKQLGKKLSSGVHCNVAIGSYGTSEELTVLAMVGERFGWQQLDSLPSGVSLPLRHELETQSNVNLISMSSPYMLHLHPVTIPSAVSDTTGLESSKFEDTDSADGSMMDGMEHIFNSSTQLRYGRDLRLNEVRRLLCSARPVAIQTSVNPSASDQDIQQAQLWHLAQRTTALPLGRGAFTLATISTLLTEAFTVPKLVLAGRLPAQQNATGKVSRTWIIYNKPEEPNVIHAGLLLALGLHGYLRVLIITDIYTYFTQEHESTTVGLMLGLAASYRGTMQPAISKTLYVHIPARHSSSFPELELPTLLQSAALVSLGLLYEGSVHPQTMQILLGEMGRRSGGDNVLEREGYAVSAGFALGLVALGRGEDALGFMDSLVDRLFHYIGGKEIHNERLLFLTPSADEHNRGIGQMMDGTAVNVDVTAPGAIIALSLMFLKTESEAIVSRLSIPQTYFDLQYVRPDFIMLRVIARNLIMWSRVHPSKDWILSQIPEIVKSGVEGLGDDINDIDDMDAETFVQAYVNIVAGACISLGLKFAGAKDGNVQELLYEYAVYFLNEIKPVSATSGNTSPKGLSRYVDRGTLEICLHLIVLSLCVVSLATGFLFLGGGMRTFSTSNSSIAALLITLYPRLPTGPNDNRCHLQAFRHLYVLATEARWIQTVDVDSGLPVYAPLKLPLRKLNIMQKQVFVKLLLLKSVRVCGPRYWPQVMELVPEGRQSLLSRAMHKVFGLTSTRACNPTVSGNSGLGAVSVDQLVSTFSSDPSLIAFAQLCCDPSWNSRSDADFREFCLQVLYECISKDRPALLQVYLSLYTTVRSMIDQVTNGTFVFRDSLAISNLKLALTYNEALLSGRLTTSRGGVVQSIFLGSLRKQVEELLTSSEALKNDLCNYLNSAQWPSDEKQGERNSVLLSWYLQWCGVPGPSVIWIAMEKIKPKVFSSSSVPLLRLLFPTTHINAIGAFTCYDVCIEEFIPCTRQSLETPVNG